MAKAPPMVSFGWSGGTREIKVAKKNGEWVTTHFVDGQPDPMLIRIFGTNEIPTPWSADTDRDVVVNELAVRNPNSNIS